MKDNTPYIIGLCGKAGSGKTSVADTIVPANTTRLDEDASTIWDHIFFAMPLYELASIKRMTLGEDRRERNLYQIHDVLSDIFGRSPAFGAPPYLDLVSLTTQLTDMHIPMEGKPRAFLQDAGSLCREKYENCFVQWAKRKAYTRGLQLLEENGEYENYACIISDVRYPNEAEMIASQPNGILIRFDASLETRQERMFKRDGHYMSEEQLNHPSEQIELIPEELLTAAIETDGMSLTDQAEATKKVIQGAMEGIYA